jgi:hypothetical protein
MSPGTGSVPRLSELAKGEQGYVRIDRRFAEPQVDVAFSRAVASLRKRDWASAARGLQEALSAHPGHPLVLVLLASCWERQPSIASRDTYLAWLREAAASPAVGIAKFIAQGNFPSLNADELYGTLVRQPAASRAAADLEQLARAAMAANRLPAALEHAEAAMKAAQGPQETLRTSRFHVEILLGLSRREQAAKEAQSLGARAETPPAEAAELAILLAKHGVADPADRLFEKALSDKELTPSARYELLVRRAAVQSGLARWRSLLAAATLAPDVSPEGSTEFDTLVGELISAEDARAAVALANETKDARLRSRLLVRQAELVIDSKLAADVAWRIHETDELPAERIAWACGVWNAAGQPGRTIAVLEKRLLRGKALGQAELKELEAAYRAAQRPVDAQRAATTAPPKQPGSPEAMSGSGGFF